MTPQEMTEQLIAMYEQGNQLRASKLVPIILELVNSGGGGNTYLPGNGISIEQFIISIANGGISHVMLDPNMIISQISDSDKYYGWKQSATSPTVFTKTIADSQNVDVFEIVNGHINNIGTGEIRAGILYHYSYMFQRNPDADDYYVDGSSEKLGNVDLLIALRKLIDAKWDGRVVFVDTLLGVDGKETDVYILTHPCTVGGVDYGVGIYAWENSMWALKFAGGSTGEQSDWNQNYPTEPSYIRNRTHWTDEDEVEVYQQDDAYSGANSGNSHNTGLIELVPGRTYNVELTSTTGKVYQNVVAELVSPEGSSPTLVCLRRNWPIIGVQSQTSANAFCLVASSAGTYELCSNDRGGLVRLRIWTNGAVHQLDPKYIPDGLKAVQPDWTQNNPSAKDFIKNRTHWEEPVIAFAKECQVADNVNYYNSGNPYIIFNDLEVGESYDVVLSCGNWTKTYTGLGCEQYSSQEKQLRLNYEQNGHLSPGVTTNAVFIGARTDELVMRSKDVFGQFVHVSIQQPGVHKLAKKFLPDDLGSAIIDVQVLPNMNIREDVIYRITELDPIYMAKYFVYKGGTWYNKSVIYLSVADYANLTSEQKNDGTVYVVDELSDMLIQFTYTTLADKPSINGVTLLGALSLQDLALYSRAQVDDLLAGKGSASFVDELPAVRVPLTWYYSRKFEDLTPVPDNKRVLYIVDKDGTLWDMGIVGNADIDLSGYVEKQTAANKVYGTDAGGNTVGFDLLTDISDDFYYCWKDARDNKVYTKYVQDRSSLDYYRITQQNGHVTHIDTVAGAKIENGVLIIAGTSYNRYEPLDGLYIVQGESKLVSVDAIRNYLNKTSKVSKFTKTSAVSEGNTARGNMNWVCVKTPVNETQFKYSWIGYFKSESYTEANWGTWGSLFLSPKYRVVLPDSRMIGLCTFSASLSFQTCMQAYSQGTTQYLEFYLLRATQVLGSASTLEIIVRCEYIGT